MGLKRIYYNTELGEWFREHFGEPFKWHGEVLEPTKLRHGYQWAQGWHSKNGYTNVSPVIWCNEKTYMLYLLRWT